MKERAPGAVAVSSRPSHRSLWWLASTVSFPIAGLAGLAVAGPVVTAGSALLGGVVTGTVIGLAQALSSACRLPLLRWAVATAAGSGVGLALAGTGVGFGTDLADLVVQGGITGVAVGLAQALALPARGRAKALWAAAPLLWAAGWAVTTLVGVDVERHYTVFGMAGALTYTLLSGAVPALTGADGDAQG